ncbi:MAG: S1 RNA-binding domain-containing protein, partial [Gemmatimonadota bacterium]|nr:S1 RNA-binding domain-containing protein [Gemmatimonadota bacterium]
MADENQEATEGVATEATVDVKETAKETAVEVEEAAATVEVEETSTEAAAESGEPERAAPSTFEFGRLDLDLDADPRDDTSYDDEEYQELLDLYEDTLSEIAEGEIVTAQVISKDDASVILDVGFKSEGAVPLDEFRNPDEVVPGDTVDVFLESLEDDEGVVVLSKKKADFLRVWEKIKAAFDEDQPVRGMIKRKIKGGVTVDLMGVDAFLPGSQIALRRVPNVEDLIGDEYDFKILKLNKRRRNIV